MGVLGRAMRGVREHLRTQLVSMATVALALFCLGCALLTVENTDALAARWGAPMRVTVYLSEGASAPQIEALRAALADLPEVAESRYVAPAEARAQLVRDGDAALASASEELFPATLELRLTSGAVDADRVRQLAERVRRLPQVSDVETYHGLTTQLRGLLSSGRGAAMLIGLLVLCCATAVVTNTVRLSLTARMKEVEVLRMVGASPDYVRAPFLVEGALLGVGGAFVALFVLGGLFFFLRSRLDGSVGNLLGVRPMFLSIPAAVGFLMAGAGLGGAGSGLAMRRWLRV